jgi:hypothetical protein
MMGDLLAGEPEFEVPLVNHSNRGSPEAKTSHSCSFDHCCSTESGS